MPEVREVISIDFTTLYRPVGINIGKVLKGLISESKKSEALRSNIELFA